MYDTERSLNHRRITTECLPRTAVFLSTYCQPRRGQRDDPIDALFDVDVMHRSNVFASPVQIQQRIIPAIARLIEECRYAVFVVLDHDHALTCQSA